MRILDMQRRAFTQSQANGFVDIERRHADTATRLGKVF